MDECTPTENHLPILNKFKDRKLIESWKLIKWALNSLPWSVVRLGDTWARGPAGMVWRGIVAV